MSNSALFLRLDRKCVRYLKEDSNVINLDGAGPLARRVRFMHGNGPRMKVCCMKGPTPAV